MNNKEYWIKRIDNVFDSNYHKNDLQKIYRTAYSKISKNIISLWDELQVAGELSTTKLYQFERFQSLLLAVEKQTDVISEKLESVITNDLTQAYKDTFKVSELLIGNSAKWGIQNDKMLNKVLNMTWAGSNYSKRIWKNTDRLAEDVKNAVIDCLTRGISKDTYVKIIKDTYNTGFHNADRLMRTELMHTINEGQRDTYLSEGIEYGEWLAADDERTCEVCGEMHGKIYRIIDMPTNPHANCRCTYIPIID